MSLLPHLYRYNRWANLALLDFCIPLNREQLSAQAPGTAYGAYGCLLHLLTSEESYYRRVSGVDLDEPALDLERLLRLADLRPRFEDIGDRYVRLADELPEDRTVVVDWEGQSRAIPAYVPFFQCIGHSAEHREQAKAGLNLAGLQPPDLQVWGWEEAGRP